MKKITVIGAGTMGNGIAHVFAMRGHPVRLMDVDAVALEKGMATIEKNLSRMPLFENDLDNISRG